MWLVRKCRLAAEMALGEEAKSVTACAKRHLRRRAGSPPSLPPGFRHPPDPPLGLGGEGLGLVVAGGRGDDLIAVLVDRPRLGCCQLALFLGLLLDLCNLLTLLGGG